MKYLPTVDVWDPAINAALRNGQLKLQCGQWIQCGEGPRSRFVGVTEGGYSIYAAHWDGSSRARADRFKSLRECFPRKSSR